MSARLAGRAAGGNSACSRSPAATAALVTASSSSVSSVASLMAPTLGGVAHDVQCTLVKKRFTVVHVDMNLLVALDALLAENSVAGAADRLHLSPPAMSRTLSRIRRATGDDILVRAGRTMIPTPRALELREETRELVRRAPRAPQRPPARTTCPASSAPATRSPTAPSPRSGSRPPAT